MPSDFLTSILPYLIIVAVSAVVLVYAGYIAISVYRGLSSAAYKSRALWTAFLAIFLALSTAVTNNVSILFPGNYAGFGIVLVYLVIYPIGILGLFVWISRTITTLIRLDYLRRDLARWSKFRWVFWGLVIIQFLFYFAVAALPQSPPLILTGYIFFILVPAAYGVVAILMGSRKTTDMTFRAHARWLGYSIGAIILLAVASGLTNNPALAAAPYLLLAYCIYKVAIYLVPVGRFRTG